jgi:hypothetical protein
MIERDRRQFGEVHHDQTLHLPVYTAKPETNRERHERALAVPGRLVYSYSLMRHRCADTEVCGYPPGRVRSRRSGRLAC